jgi:hypothetical protein
MPPAVLGRSVERTRHGCNIVLAQPARQWLTLADGATFATFGWMDFAISSRWAALFCGAAKRYM